MTEAKVASSSNATDGSTKSFPLHIECSDQPLDFSFHPNRPSILATGLVDGTVEIHDIQELLSGVSIAGSDDDDDDEVDTLVSSTLVHTQVSKRKPSTQEGTVDDGMDDASETQRQASCRSVLFLSNGLLFSGGTGGDLAQLDAERVCTFSAANNDDNGVIRSIPDAAYEQSPIHILHEMTEKNLLVTGDDAGGVRIWDVRSMGRPSATKNHDPTTNSARRPQGCLYSWHKHTDYVSGLDHHDNTLVACSADGTISVYDLRMPSATNQAKLSKSAKKRQKQREKQQKPQTVPAGPYERLGLAQQSAVTVRQSDHQDDELLSLRILKQGNKVVCGTALGVLNVWSWGTWGDISDRFPGHPASLDALERVDADTLLTGASDGLIRVVTIHPDQLLGVIGGGKVSPNAGKKRNGNNQHGGFPVERLEVSPDRKYVASMTHDNIVRLWDARILYDDNYEDDNEADVTSALHSSSDSRNNDGEKEESSDSDDEEEDSDDSDDEAPAGKKRKVDRRANRFVSENEQFFADL